MSIYLTFLTFILVWWSVLFMALPIGIKSISETSETNPLYDKSAPQKPNIKLKLSIVTAISLILTTALYLAAPKIYSLLQYVLV